jgi:NADH:ubiquinone oxidoreductase subunit H
MDWTLWLEWAIKSLILIFTLLIGFGYLTYYERRFLALLQSRLGPKPRRAAGVDAVDGRCGQADLQGRADPGQRL